MSLLDSDKITKLKQKAANLYNRTVDQEVTLAVTGLSRSGKTAFITSLVNQLINEGQGPELSFFNPVHEGRFLAAKRVPQQHMQIKRFDYETSFEQFCLNPPSWPKPTHGISEIRLALRYKPKDSFLRYATDHSTLFLNITDYPGEWLLDLPMLNQTYEEWSEQMTLLLQSAPRNQLATPFLEKMQTIDPLAAGNEDVLAEVAAQYTELLHRYRHEYGLSVIQPGRFILPCELEGAPLLQFVPYPFFTELDDDDYQDANSGSYIAMLRARFLEYKEHVVRKFYKQHFVNFDRQIVLADVLTPLNNGPASFDDLQMAINLILESFNYGQSSLFSRLFSPKIDKLMFAASKADHVTHEQHGNMVSLLEQLVHKAKKRLEFDNIEMKTLAIASVKCTQSGTGMHDNQSIPVIHGKQLSDESTITLFPGAVPDKLPDSSYWQSAQFKFVEFLPMNSVAHHQVLPHLRLDQILQFLLGDKMK